MHCVEADQLEREIRCGAACKAFGKDAASEFRTLQRAGAAVGDLAFSHNTFVDSD
jgi:hypothetical protein